MTDLKAVAPALRKIHASRFKAAEHVRNVWAVVPEAGVPFEDMLEPAYWSHVAAKLRGGDVIEVYPEDATYFARLMVRRTARLEAVVSKIEQVVFDAAAEPTIPADTYEAAWKGPHRKWSVVRLADKEIVKDGFENRDGATTWIASHLKALAA